MTLEVRKEILLHGLRWAGNILVEVLSNHARSINPEAADLVAKASSLIEEAQHLLRVGR